MIIVIPLTTISQNEFFGVHFGFNWKSFYFGGQLFNDLQQSTPLAIGHVMNLIWHHPLDERLFVNGTTKTHLRGMDIDEIVANRQPKM